MENVGLKIVLDAEAQGAVKGIETVNKALNTMPAAANKAGAALGKVGASAANATPTLINFGRVVQDAPFGLIGIANNIDPLISSFQSLKASTGSTGLAFKALAGSLLGPAGIGIAVSAVTSALIAFGPKLFGASKEAKAAKDETEKFAQSLRDAAAGATKTGLELQAFVNIAKDNTKSFEERNYALVEANKLMGEHGEKLTLVNINTAAATAEINKFTAAMVAQAVATKLADRLGDTVIKVKELQKEYKKAVETFESPEIQRARFTGSALKDSEFDKAKDKVKETVTAYRLAVRELNTQSDEFNSTIAESVNLFAQIGTKTKDAKKGTKDFSDFVQGLRDQLFELNAEASKDPFAKIETSTNKLFNQFFDLKSKGKLTANDIIDAPGIIEEIDKLQREVVNIKLFDNETKTAAKQSAENWALVYKTSLKTALSQIVPAIPEISAEEATKSLRNALAGIDAQMNAFGLRTTAQLAAFDAQVTELLNSIAVDGVAAVADSIGNALAGAKNPFDGLLLVLANGLQSLGKMVIATFLTIQALKDVLKSVGVTNPVVGIAIGAAMVALGSLIKAKVSQTKFADGGIVTGPTNALIGEAGPEVVFPLDRIREFMGNDRGSMQPIVLTTAVRGSDLLLVQQRAGASYGRTNG